jgi:hypothetical protein
METCTNTPQLDRRQTSNFQPTLTDRRAQAPVSQPNLNDIYLRDVFQKRHSEKFTRAQLVWMIRNRKTNGLEESGAVLKVARKFYIIESIFEKWIINRKA